MPLQYEIKDENHNLKNNDIGSNSPLRYELNIGIAFIIL